MSMMEIWKLFGTLFVFSGSLVVLYGGRLLADRRALARAGAPIEGMVIRRVAGTGSKARYHPVVLFHTPQGDPVVFQSPEALPDEHCRVGTRLPVLYDGADPRGARVCLSGWYDVVMTFYLGVLVTGAGLVLTLQQMTH